MHWGYKVAVLYCSFVVFMIFMVYKATTQDFSLVSEDYYKDEIEYQQQIDKKENSAMLTEKLNIEPLYDENKVRISYPRDIATADGEILFYRPSDAGKDIRVAVNPNAEYFQDVSLENMQKGLWRVRVDWNAGGKEYFDEKSMVLQ